MRSARATNSAGDRVTVSALTPDPDPGNNVAEDEVTVSAAANIEAAEIAITVEPSSFVSVK